MVDKARGYYTVERRLGDILGIYPVERGSLWFVLEEAWEQANRSYAVVRNPDRTGHFGLAAATLTATCPTTVPLLHGHSITRDRDKWFHLAVAGVTEDERTRETWFDAWHRYPVAWREFFSDNVRRNLDKTSLATSELTRLMEIENLIRAKTRHDCARALNEYQRHPAWQRHFPEAVPHSSTDTDDGGTPR